MSKHILGIFAAFALVAAFFTGTAFADDGAALLELARPIFDAVMAGQYPAAVALALVLAVAAIRRYAPWAWVKSDAGGVVMTLIASFGGAAGTALLAGATISAGMAWAAFGVAVTAAGGYVMIKKLLVVPLLRPLREMAPSWARPAFDLALWAFEDRGARADAAGAAAVAENPAGGVVSIVGEPEDIK